MQGQLLVFPAAAATLRAATDRRPVLPAQRAATVPRDRRCALNVLRGFMVQKKRPQRVLNVLLASSMAAPAQPPAPNVLLANTRLPQVPPNARLAMKANTAVLAPPVASRVPRPGTR